MDEMRPSPRNRLMGMIADALGSVNDYAQRRDPAGGMYNPPLSMVANALALPSLATTAQRASYGSPLTNAGQANTPFLKPETADALMMAPLSPRTALGMAGLAVGADKNALQAMLLYHGSNSTAPLKGIEKGGGPFGGLFAGDANTAASHGNFVYRMTIPDDQIMHHGLDVGDAALNVVRKRLGGKIGRDDLQTVADIVASDSGEIPAHLIAPLAKANPYGEIGAPGADASWYLQRLRGETAEAAGYKAAAMRDEHGTSYLVNDVKPRPYNEEARLLARGQYIAPPPQPILPFKAPAPRPAFTIEQWRALPESQKAARVGDITSLSSRREMQEVSRYK
jgi:hypothetical protein